MHPAPGTTGDQEVSPHRKGAIHPPPRLHIAFELLESLVKDLVLNSSKSTGNVTKSGEMENEESIARKDEIK